MGDISDIFGGTFDASSVEITGGAFDPLPAGWYPVMIDNAEVKVNKAGNGKYLKLKMTVIGENYTGRKLFPMLNVIHPNPETVRIAKERLAELSLACDIPQIDESAQLIGKSVMARVKIRPAKGDYEADNEITGYKALGGTGYQPPATSGALPSTPNLPKPAAVAQPSAKRPWER